jgi:transposase InsO family protein
VAHKTEHQPDGYDRNTEIALFRYGLIAPVIHNPPPKGQLEQALRDLAAQCYQSPTSACTRVSVTTLRRYLKAYRAGGFDALRPVPRDDVGAPRAFSPELLERAIALREQQPARTTRTLVDILARDERLKLDKLPNPHTLATHLRQAGKTRRLLARTPTAFRRFEKEAVNALWQGDALVGPWLPDPQLPARKRRAHLFCFLDDHSRLVPYAEFFFDEALPRMERVLKVALLRRGLPKAIYVDNGQVYSSIQFGAALATLGIRRFQTAPYAPEGKGKQERFFETLRLQFLPEVEASAITTLAQLNESLWAWLERVYHQHLHSETHQTPLARFAAGLEQVKPVDPETLRRAFLWREKRTVRKDATISLQGNRYQVPSHLVGRALELRFDPFDLAEMDLYLDGKELGRARVLLQGRSRHLAVQGLDPEPTTAAKANPSVDFLAALRAEQQSAQQQALSRLSFASLSPSAKTTPNNPEA